MAAMAVSMSRVEQLLAVRRRVSASTPSTSSTLGIHLAVYIILHARSPHGVPRDARVAAESMARAHVAAMDVSMSCVEQLLAVRRSERASTVDLYTTLDRQLDRPPSRCTLGRLTACHETLALQPNAWREPTRPPRM